jgi:hypothetical protein
VPDTETDPLLNVERVISRAGRLGREIVTNKLRMKAQNRKKSPGMQNARLIVIVEGRRGLG